MMGDLYKLAIIAASLMGYVNFALLLIIDNKLGEIKATILKLKKEKDNG